MAQMQLCIAQIEGQIADEALEKEEHRWKVSRENSADGQ